VRLVEQCGDEEELACGLLFGFYDDVVAGGDELVGGAVDTHFCVVFERSLLLSFLAAFAAVVVEGSAVYFDDSTEQDDDFGLFVEFESGLLSGFYFGVEGEIDNLIEIRVFVELVVEGVEHEEEFDFLHLISGPVVFVFAEDVDDRHVY
jgi:hypothetical protein